MGSIAEQKFTGLGQVSKPFRCWMQERYNA